MQQPIGGVHVLANHILTVFTDELKVTTNESSVDGAVSLTLKLNDSRWTWGLSLQQATDIVEALSMAVACASPAQDVTNVRDCESVDS